HVQPILQPKFLERPQGAERAGVDAVIKLDHGRRPTKAAPVAQEAAACVAGIRSLIRPSRWRFSDGALGWTLTHHAGLSKFLYDNYDAMVLHHLSADGPALAAEGNGPNAPARKK